MTGNRLRLIEVMEIPAAGTTFPTLCGRNSVKIVATLILAALCSMPAIACDKVDAAKVQFALSEMGAQWSEKDGRVTFHWGWEWDGAARAQRLGLLRAFADGDVCLAGQTREISFYRKGKLVGKASPRFGVQLVSDATVTVQASASSFPPSRNIAGCPN
jgi:hypothetical protein